MCHCAVRCARRATRARRERRRAGPPRPRRDRRRDRDTTRLNIGLLIANEASQLASDLFGADMGVLIGGLGIILMGTMTGVITSLIAMQYYRTPDEAQSMIESE